MLPGHRAQQRIHYKYFLHIPLREVLVDSEGNRGLPHRCQHSPVEGVSSCKGPSRMLLLGPKEPAGLKGMQNICYSDICNVFSGSKILSRVLWEIISRWKGLLEDVMDHNFHAFCPYFCQALLWPLLQDGSEEKGTWAIRTLLHSFYASKINGAKKEWVRILGEKSVKLKIGESNDS